MKLPYFLLLFLGVEILSFLSFAADFFMPLCFAFLATACYLLSARKLEYGLMLILAELASGSLGYLFWLDTGTYRISIRIGLWVVFMLVWFFYYAWPEFREFVKKGGKIRRLDPKSPEFWFAALGVFALLGVFWGWFNGYPAKDIFLDFNGWLFFLLIFPVRTILKKRGEKTLKNILQAITAALLWLCLKSIFLLFMFSHDFAILPVLYEWVRDTRAGEITRMDGGFARVFMQSHIYASAAFFVYFIMLLKKLPSGLDLKSIKEKRLAGLLAMSVLTGIVSIISLSRSNWAGMMLGLLVVLAYVFVSHPETRYRPLKIKLDLARFFRSIGLLAGLGAVSISLVFILISVPLPGSKQRIEAGKDLKQRLFSQNDAAVASRWDLLRPLSAELADNAVLGAGFGKTVSYRSSDPRAAAQSNGGLYTTYAFEWGWLDIWLKIGIFGFLSYLMLLASLVLKGLKTVYSGLSDRQELILGLVFGLLIISGINFFSPYLNHPLGISYIIITYFFIKAAVRPIPPAPSREMSQEPLPK